MNRLCFAMLCFASLAGCNDTPSGTSGAKPTGASPAQPDPAAAAAPAAATNFKLPTVGLQVDVVGGSEVMQVGTGDGVAGKGGVVVSVMKEPRSLDDEKSDDLTTYNAKNFKSETLADGWVATFDNAGPAGPKFFVKARRDIGGTSYLCQTSAKTSEEITLSVAACKSLRK